MQILCLDPLLNPPGLMLTDNTDKIYSGVILKANMTPYPPVNPSVFFALEQENNQFIKTTGTIPVLLTYGDHDAAFPPNTAQADYQYWVTNCPGCDVTEWYEPNSGHLFMAHTSMPQWVQEVVTWLASRGISST